MADITTYSDDHWALSDGVRDKVHIKKSGEPIPVTDAIESATDSVHSWWKDGTGLDYPADLPDPSTLQDKNSLLADATAYLAASQKHETQTENVRAYDGEDRTERKFVFLESRAKKKFDAWITLYGYDEPGGDSDSGDEASQVGTPTIGTARIGALVDTPSKEGSLNYNRLRDGDNG